MADAELRKKMAEKIEEGEFEVADLPEFMGLFCAISNESDDIQDEVEGWSRKFQITPTDGAEAIWLVVDDGKFSTGTGSTDGADVTLKATGKNTAAILIGDKDATAAYMSGELAIEGAKPDAIRLRAVIEIVREEIEG